MQSSMQRAAGMSRREQPDGRLLKRCVVGHLPQMNRFAQVAAIDQQRRQLSVVQPQEFFQHQASEELWLRELLRAVPMRIPRQRPTTDHMSEHENATR